MIPEDMTIFEIGKPFPGPVLQQEGSIMELWDNRLYVIIQYPELTTQEKKIFENSFAQYSYLETSTPVPIAMWVFDFPKPFGAIEANFNARLSDRDNIKEYLKSDSNGLTFFLLDGNILAGMKVGGLHLEAVKLFQKTIQKQLDMEYSQEQFLKYLQAMYHYTPDELIQMGKRFQK